MIHVIIPMAGRGQRFVDAGYENPKPFINIKGKPMIARVIENLPQRNGGVLKLIAGDDPEWQDILWGIARTYEAKVVQLDKITGGAACTVLEGLSGLEEFPEVPIVVANCDQYLDWMPNHFVEYAQKHNADGAIATFKASGPKWSYADVQDDGSIAAVAEKIPISREATCGIYYFKDAFILREAILQMMAKDIRTNGEFYLAPCYNEMIADGMKVMNYPVPKMYGLGTPEDLLQTWEFDNLIGVFK